MLRVIQRYCYLLVSFITFVATSLAMNANAAQIYGSGGFQPGNLGGGVGSPYAAAVGDFNNDGNLDVAVIKNNNNGSGSVAIYTRNAIGTLTLTHDYGIFNLVNPREVLAVDLNGDGKLDLVITDDAGVAVLLGVGDPTASFTGGGLTLRPPIDSGAGYGAESTVVLDINHDGIPDLFTFTRNSNGNDVISLSLGIGGGQFVDTLSLGSGYLHQFDVVKIDNDNEPDLVTVTLSKLFFQKGLGSGFFLPASFSLDFSGTVGPLGELRMIDLDGDGKVDAVLSNFGGTGVWMAKGNGDGTFNTPTLLFSSGIQYDSSRDMGRMVIADINGDGRLDIVTDGYVALQQANHTFVYNEHIGGNFIFGDPISAYPATRMLAGVKNASGRIDLLTGGPPPSDTNIVVYQPVAASVSDLFITGAPQSTPFNTAFANPLTVTVKDSNHIGVPNLNVTFTVPFGVGVASATPFTAVTNGQGKVSYTPTANGVLGCYQVPAIIATVAIQPTFDLCNTGANTLTVLPASNNQTTLVNTAFGNVLQVQLKNSSNVAVQGVTVSFSNPASGAGATFAPTSGTTDGSGVIFVNATANSIAGAYQLLVSAPGTTPTVIKLNNSAPANAAAALAVDVNTPQYGYVTKPFSGPIIIHVTDFFNNPVTGVTVNFALTPDPATGATATFSALTAVTNAQGNAQVTATANGFIGQYSMKVTLPNNPFAAPKSFALKNIASLPKFMVLTSGNPQSTPVNTAFTKKLRVKVTDSLNAVTPQVRVYFIASANPGANATLSPSSALADATGFAEVTATANGVIGAYQVGAIVFDTSTESPITQLFNLTNLAAVIPDFVLTVTKSGAGTGTVTGTGITCGADCTETLAQNTVVLLTAAPLAGSTFAGWSGAGCSGTGTCSVTMSAAQTVNAQFDVIVVPTFLLTVTKSGAGTGTVTGTGITCGADCTETLAKNTVVVLTAGPTAGSTFAGWTGAGCSGTGICSVTMSAAQTVNAQFDVVVVPTFLSTVTKSGAGTGTVTGTGITCGVDCTETLAQNTVVVLTAGATAGSTFAGWTGAGCSGTGTCSVTMSAAQTVNAQFDVIVVPTFLLTVTKSGAGTGTVTGTGITCGADCTETLAQNTVVLLTAAPLAGSTFAGWTGAGCSGTGTCSVTMSAAQTVNAQFDVVAAPTFLLTVTKSGSGTGNVTGTGITCGADCTETLAQNTVVLLTAAPIAGSTFAGWTGAGCSGTGTCSVTVSAAQTVNAQFDVLPPPVIVATPVPTLHPALLALLTLLMAGAMLLTTARRWR